MRLWHRLLIPYLPNDQLKGQHNECCALRGLGWGRKHIIVDYVFKYPYYYLYNFHMLVIAEIEARNKLGKLNYKINPIWKNNCYRGQNIGMDFTIFTNKYEGNLNYPEHNDEYLKICYENLVNKGHFIKLIKHEKQ